MSKLVLAAGVPFSGLGQNENRGTIISGPGLPRRLTSNRYEEGPHRMAKALSLRELEFRFQDYRVFSS